MRSSTILVLTALFLWGCNLVQSPLSDVPLTSPTGLQLIAVVDRAVTPNGGITTTIRANLYDKHGEYVKILDGGMRLNGLQMRDGSYGDYIDDVTPVLPAMRYRFDVVYSDGSVDSAAVHTPANLTSLMVPSSTDRVHAFTVAWGSADARDRHAGREALALTFQSFRRPSLLSASVEGGHA